jgi:hypothetical protein
MFLSGSLSVDSLLEHKINLRFPQSRLFIYITECHVVHDQAKKSNTRAFLLFITSNILLRRINGFFPFLNLTFHSALIFPYQAELFQISQKKSHFTHFPSIS